MNLKRNEHWEFLGHDDEDAETRRKSVYASIAKLDPKKLALPEMDSRGREKRKCPECDTVYGVNAPNQVYCCDECRRSAARKRRKGGGE